SCPRWSSRCVRGSYDRRSNVSRHNAPLTGRLRVRCQLRRPGGHMIRALTVLLVVFMSIPAGFGAKPPKDDPDGPPKAAHRLDDPVAEGVVVGEDTPTEVG